LLGAWLNTEAARVLLILLAFGFWSTWLASVAIFGELCPELLVEFDFPIVFKDFVL